MSTLSTNSKPLTDDAVAMPADEATMARRYVRITGRSETGFVHFEYSVGWPDMAVELTLPEDMFKEFCKKNQVQFLAEEAGAKLGDHDDEH